MIAININLRSIHVHVTLLPLKTITIIVVVFLLCHHQFIMRLNYVEKERNRKKLKTIEIVEEKFRQFKFSVYLI